MIQMSEALSADQAFWVRAVIFSAFIATIVSYIVSQWSDSGDSVDDFF